MATEPVPPCSPFVLDDGSVGFVCHAGSNTPELIAWRLGLRPVAKVTIDEGELHG